MNTETKTVKKIPADCATDRLQRIALRWLNDSADYANGATGRFADLMHGGCQSGIVGHLIYSADCRAFLKRHREAINALLAEELENSGYKSPAEILTDWDVSDPLGIDTNADRLAWFGFEQAARIVAQRAGIET